mgnify:CR=1 FL=1
MYKEYLDRKWEWVDENPRTAAWLGFVKGIVFGIGLVLLFGCSAEHRYHKSKEEIPNPKWASVTPVNRGVDTLLYTPLNLDALDSVGCIYHWEIYKDTLRISTVDDEIQNELLRLKELKDLYYE